VGDDPLTEKKREAAPLDGRRLGAAALLLAFSVFLSRIMGFVREAVLAARVGVGAEMDAYRAAFQIPDMLNYLLAGGALAIAFTPLYLGVKSREGDERATDFFHTVLGNMGAIVVLLTTAVWWWSEALIGAVFTSFDAETTALTVRITRIVLPAQIFFVTGGIVRAVLMAHGRFRAQAAAGLLYNAGIIAGGFATGTVEGFAWGALVGAVLGNWAYPLYDMRHVGRTGVRLAPWDPRFHAYLWQALPLMIGLSLTTVDEWYEKLLGQRAGEGAIAALGYARALMMAPVAIIGQAVAAAALPTLSALHAGGRARELDETLLSTLRGTLVLGLFAAVGVSVLAEPIVELLYQRGRFTAEDVARVSGLLSLLALAIPGWVTQQVAVRGFFARSETWRPMLLGSVLALAVLPVYFVAGDRFGAEGLAAAGVFAISLNAVITLGWLRVRFGGPPLEGLLSSGLRALLLAVVAGGAAAVALEQLPVVGTGSFATLLRLVASGALFGVVSLVGVQWMGDRAMRESFSRLTGRIPGLRRLLKR